MNPSAKLATANRRVEGRIVVVGSANMDMVVSCDRFPRPGETVLGSTFNMFPGGKGANQAVAAARLGADVHFIGKMGSDLFRTRLLESLVGDGVHTEHVLQDPVEPTGVAMISVDGAGENEIVVVSGSNMRLSPAEIEAERPLIESASVMMLQLEVPLETVIAAARIAREVGCAVVLNPAPAAPLSDDLLECADVITPNETEASILTGIDVNDEASAERAGRALLARGAGCVVVTMGSRGALLVEPERTELFPAFAADVVDTTGAGDAFNGGLAFGLATGQDIKEAIRLGNRVASFSVSHAGAQTSLPTPSDIGLEDAAAVSDGYSGLDEEGFLS